MSLDLTIIFPAILKNLFLSDILIIFQEKDIVREKQFQLHANSQGLILPARVIRKIKGIVLE